MMATGANSPLHDHSTFPNSFFQWLPTSFQFHNCSWDVQQGPTQPQPRRAGTRGEQDSESARADVLTGRLLVLKDTLQLITYRVVKHVLCNS